METLGNAEAHLSRGAVHYVCMDWRHLGELLAAGRQIYSEMLNLVVWAKSNAGQGSFYRSQHELMASSGSGTSRTSTTSSSGVTAAPGPMSGTMRA